MKDLDSIRQEIDSLDSSMVDLLNRRASLAQAIGTLKGRDGKPFFSPERERQVFEHLKSKNQGPLLNQQLQAIYREVISAARALEQQIKVAYWGPPGTFTNMAASQCFGSSSQLVATDSIYDVFMTVERGEADYGVVPVENSLGGIVPETLDAFPLTNVKICSEMMLQIRHHLVSNCEALSEVQTVFAGPQPVSQCRRWLRDNLPKAELIEVVPTSRAAERALNHPNSAAIANELGAEILGIPILVPHIQDHANNRTRFLVVGFNEPVKTGRDKTSLMFNLRNQPGELYHALGALYKHQVNLQMIESRPAQRSQFEYLFFVDCIGHKQDENVSAAIAELGSLALETVNLGSYPSAD
ncbi:MAG: prephenate dehydratase [Fimbriimonadaceae bacterium]